MHMFRFRNCVRSKPCVIGRQDRRSVPPPEEGMSTGCSSPRLDGSDHVIAGAEKESSRLAADAGMPSLR